jgi:hypothetical protein
MIYRSLIRAWHQPLVPPIYVVLALATGVLLLNLLLVGFGVERESDGLGRGYLPVGRLVPQGTLLVEN